MKVTRTSDVGTPEPVEGARRPAKPEEDFGRVFQEELNQIASGAQQATRADAGTAPLETTPTAPFALGPIRISESGTVERVIDSTMDRLDQVGRLLGDITVTPRAVNQAIDQLSTQAEELRQAVQTLPTEHPLQQIGNEISVLATVEAIKWKRGDYL
jgi:hypothetical protein